MTNASQQLGWEFWGSELKSRREGAGLTQEEMGLRLFMDRTLVSRLESAERKPRLQTAIQVDKVFKADGFFERLCRKLLEASPYASYFAPVADLEKRATQICEFAPSAIPGLFQTAAYARAITIAANPFATDAYVEEKVSSRLERATILKSTRKPEYWAVLHETTLRVPVGSPTVMAEQLEHIASVARKRMAVVTVLPHAAGEHASMGGMFTLMDFDDAPPTIYTETSFAGTLMDDPAVVKRAQRAYDLLRGAALPPEAALTLIESTAEDYRRCETTT
ncbi:Scr1 family TA system antitoxin-like transcriptional regulator [Streptomyces decoyicus]|uniref:helix-turn-helix domain-containing protein n=1 Tax=Streptomyces decoyicus TaxID=249567 RepID=UPI00362B13BB